MIATITNPRMDKHYCLTINGATQDDYYTMMSLFNNPSFRVCRPFMQGWDPHSGWMMVEFWTDNQDHILEACLKFEQSFEIKISN